MNDRIIISPTIWVPVMLILLTLAVVGGVRLADGDETPTRTVADDCYSDLVVKQQTGQIGRYGIVWGLGENAPLTRGVLKSICETAWSIDGPRLSPQPYACGGHLLQDLPDGTPYPDPDCAPPSTPQPTCTMPLVPKCRVEPPGTVDASPTVQTPTPTAAALPDTGGMP